MASDPLEQAGKTAGLSTEPVDDIGAALREFDEATPPVERHFPQHGTNRAGERREQIGAEEVDSEFTSSRKPPRTHQASSSITALCEPRSRPRRTPCGKSVAGRTLNAC